MSNVLLLYMMGEIMNKYEITVPVKVLIKERKRTKEKYFRLNLNNYRNASYHILSDAKRNYSEVIRPLLEGLCFLEKVNINYKLFIRVVKKEKRIDTNNILTIVDKFFCDSLVSNGILKDDNYNVLGKTTFEFGGFDYNCEDHYVVVKIEEV